VTQSITGNADEFMLMFRFESLKGSFAMFTSCVERAEIFYEQQQDSMTEKSRLDSMQCLCKFAADSGGDVCSDSEDIRAKYHHLHNVWAEIGPEISVIESETADLMKRFNDQVNEMLDVSDNHRREQSFGHLTKEFLKSFF
jgi:hypothetical protein